MARQLSQSSKTRAPVPGLFWIPTVYAQKGGVGPLGYGSTPHHLPGVSLSACVSLDASRPLGTLLSHTRHPFGGFGRSLEAKYEEAVLE